MNELILGDVITNKINGNILPATYIIPHNKINNSGVCTLLFSDLNIAKQTAFSILYNEEVFYPDYKWTNNGLIIDFGKAVNVADILKIIFISNI